MKLPSLQFLCLRRLEMSFMFRIPRSLLIGLLALCQAIFPVAHAEDGSGAFRTGKYRDLFAEIGYSPEESRARISDAFHQLFHGDPKKETIFYEAGRNSQGPLAFITDIANH